MSATRLRNLTAVFLTTLYGVVGLTGPSIHYLVTEGWTFGTAQAAHHAGGYYHVHAPDYHGHWHSHQDGHAHHGQAHSHSHGDSHSHTNLAASEERSKSVVGVELTSRGTTHAPHSCPALTLVSTLKLSQAGSRCTPLVFESVGVLPTEVRCMSAFEVTRLLFARGPPANSFA